MTRVSTSQPGLADMSVRAQPEPVASRAGTAMPNRRALLVGLSAAGFGAALPSRAEAQEATVNLADTARILAGLAPADDSPLAALTRSAAFREHERAFARSWARLEGAQLARIRTWAKAEMPPPRDTLYYFFSGPDFLYANLFFPAAKTIVMGGLEPVGRIPQATVGNLRGLPQLRRSLNSLMSFSFFQTKHMRAELGGNVFAGTLPLIYVFLARAGKNVEETELIGLDDAAKAVPAGSTGARPAINGCRIVYTTPGDPTRRTIYYVQADISDRAPGADHVLAFAKTLGTGDAFVKSASYLMHHSGFSKVRDFILANAGTVLQDDSGIPVRHFAETDWNLRAIGRYTGPIGLFSNHHQPALASLFRQQSPPQLPFGIGYRFRPRESSLLLATRRVSA